MKMFGKAITALCVAALASAAFATIQPKRVGPVSQYGALQAGKNAAGEGRIYGSVDGVTEGKEVQVKGMSLTWSMYWPYGSSFYGNTFIDTLVGGWNVELIRSAMGVVPPWGHGGYMTRPEYFEAQMDTVVQAAIENDVYVLIDWHSEGGYFNCIHPGEKPAQTWMKFNDNKTCFSAADAAKFFGKMAERYGKYPHVIFEIYNEPVAETWADLKAYADTVIAAIRPHSNNLIVVGNPQWSSQAGEAVADPVNDPNVAYTYHFYADIHTTQEHIASSNKAMAAGLSVMVTEWGGIDQIFTKESHKTQLEEFLAWTTEKKLSYAKWDVEKPFLEDNDVDNYMKANILPQKTTYEKKLDWAATITDNLPNLVTYGEGTEIAGKWSTTSDIDDYGDPDGHKGNSTFDDNTADGVVKMDNMNLDTVGTGFDYAPYIRAEYSTKANLSKCKMIQYSYKGANHQFTLYYDWNASEEFFGEGAWDYPFVEMPYAPEWETVNIDLGWAMSNGWQPAIPTYPVLEQVTAFRFLVTNDFFDKSLWVKDLKCVTEVTGYTFAAIPEYNADDAIKPSFAKANFGVNVNGKNIAVSGIAAGTKYSLSNMLGQTLVKGSANGSVMLTAPRAGRYVLRVGNETRAITIK
ncbi:glycoside hydrolase family 5 protein [Fibrobacter sp. UWEL]|uniref:glycoside hydrolase family 5 protein n=1 Tax=Fibrobacter sp. UWEL TaxID=1896209 RepID=UPI000923C12F|nr:glycoside hydrolase family 5 protein [Fibrobacter sp. UWEL]SHK80689.1 endoglucanase [Fibrobacter sp. UWEL]